MRSLAALAATLALAGAAAGASTASEAALRGAQYIAARQAPNGAFFRADAPAHEVAEALGSVVAGGLSGRPVANALTYIAANGPGAIRQGAHAGRMVMGLVAAGQNPRDFHGHDYVARLERFYDPASGVYDRKNLYSNALALLGVIAGGEAIPERALTYLRDNQCPQGGFSWAAGCADPLGPDLDTTALVICALAGAGLPPSDLSLSRARTFLVAAQNPSGGFGQYTGWSTNANSTGLVLSALAALGESARASPWDRGEGKDPLSALLALQDASGGFRWRADDERPNDYATVQAVPGAAGRAYPLLSPASAPHSDAGPGDALSAARPARVGAGRVPSARSAPSLAPSLPLGRETETAETTQPVPPAEPERQVDDRGPSLWAPAGLAALLTGVALVGRVLSTRGRPA